ncbi:uncharacterized protein LOC133334116 [Musca vetustissima]|uniref:uncharacterized protein LOC133334116 n=1 Tax=Musca vetustissima TaxID=27455 RepID=UPI002AB648F4|nr:uncharacterized protein LOC133334116 [Musca vetustissima]
MKHLSTQQEIVLKLNLLDSRVTRTKLLLDYYRRRRNNSIKKLQMLQVQQLHLLCALLEEPRPYRTVWTYSQETNFWEIEAQQMPEDVFKDKFGVNRKSFNKLCEFLTPMTKLDSEFRKCIPLDKRIAICLYALRHSTFYSEVGSVFGIGKSTVCILLKELIQFVVETMHEKYMPKEFLTPEVLKECVEGFEKLGVPQCCGVLDGHRFNISCNMREGRDYLTLLALVDHNHKIRYAYVDSNDGWNYPSVYNKTDLPQMFSRRGEILKTMSKNINGIEVPIFMIADTSFNLSEHVMKPYVYGISSSDPEKIFNNNLLKCHQVVGETFTQLKARFRRLTNGIPSNIANGRNTIYICCILHNFLLEQNYEIPREWIEKQSNLDRLPNSSGLLQEFETIEFDFRAEEIRNCLASYMYDTQLKTE